ncbi:MAG: glycosyltransferase, partial [Thermoanaerobaculia bacterium]
MRSRRGARRCRARAGRWRGCSRNGTRGGSFRRAIRGRSPPRSPRCWPVDRRWSGGAPAASSWRASSPGSACSGPWSRSSRSRAGTRPRSVSPSAPPPWRPATGSASACAGASRGALPIEDIVPPVDKLSVLIVSWNGRHHLEECLGPLFEQRRGAGAELEILVLDNGSSDGTSAWLAARFPEARVVASPVNLGFAAGNNLLAREASGDLLLLLNNDTRPEPRLLSAFIDSWRAAPPDVAALAGRLLDWNGARLDFGRGIATFDGHAFALDQGRELGEARVPRPGEELLFGCGGNLLAARRSFLAAGGFDESYFAYYEDVDLGWRLWAGGERILACPEAAARHRQGATGARLGDFRRGALFERNALLTVAKNFEDGLWERMLPAVLLTFLARIEAMVATANPGGELLRGEPAFRRPGAQGARRRLADLLRTAALPA